MVRRDDQQRRRFDRSELKMWLLALDGWPPTDWAVLMGTLAALYLLFLAGACLIPSWWKRLLSTVLLLLPLVLVLLWALRSRSRALLYEVDLWVLANRISGYADQMTESSRKATDIAKALLEQLVETRSHLHWALARLREISEHMDAWDELATELMAAMNEGSVIVGEGRKVVSDLSADLQQVEQGLDLQKRLDELRSDAANRYWDVIGDVEQNPGVPLWRIADHHRVSEKTVRRALGYWPGRDRR